MYQKFFRSSIFWFIFSVVACVIPYWRWFFTFDIFTWGDWGYQNQEFIKQLFNFPQAWYREFLGIVDVGLPQYLVTRFFYSLLAQFFPPQVFDRIIFLWPIVLIPIIGIFLLVKHITKNSFAGFVGAIVYMFNSYILLLYTGHLTLAAGFGFAPLIFLLFKKTIYKKSLRYSISTGLAGIICAAYEPRGFFMIAMILVTYLIFSVFLINDSAFRSVKIKMRSIFLGFLPFVIILFANTYWIFAFLQTVATYEKTILNREIVGKFAFIFPRPFLIFSPWWTGGGKDAWGAVQPIPWYFWIIPFVAFLGFWFGRKKSDVVFWALIALIGIFFTKSLGQPFGSVYPFLYNNFPGFNLFRDSSKFLFFTSLAYSVLIGEFIAWLWTKESFAKIGKIIITAVILLAFLYNGTFLFSQKLGHLQVPRHVPKDYLIFRDFTFKQPEFMRTLYVPEWPRWVHRDIDHRTHGVSSLVRGEWSQLSNYNKIDDEYSAFDELTNIFKKPFADELFDSWSVKYVVVALEDKENEDINYPNDVTAKQFEDFLTKQPYLKRTNIGTEKLAVFENENPSPHYVFTPSVKYDVNCPDATSCKFVFQSNAKNMKFYFAESYHPGWKIRMGNFHWWDSLLSKNYFQSDSSHLRTKFGANEYMISDIKSGDEMTLYFAPQAKVNVGIIISIATVVLSFGTLLVLVVRDRRK